MFESKRKPAKAPAKPTLVSTNAAKLKKLGVIDYDLRKTLTESQKKKIRRLSHELKPVLDKPAEFAKVKASTKGNAQAARESGLIVTGKNVFVPKGNYANVKMVDNRIIKTQPPAFVKLPSGKVQFQRKKEVLLLHTRLGMLEYLEKMKGHYLPPGVTLMVKIGRNAGFPGNRGPTQRMDYGALSKYMNQWKTDDMKDFESGKYGGKYSYDELEAIRDGLISEMSLVSYEMR